MKIKVAIFEDNPKFMEAFSIMVKELPGLELTGGYLNTEDLISFKKEHPGRSTDGYRDHSRQRNRCDKTDHGKLSECKNSNSDNFRRR